MSFKKILKPKKNYSLMRLGRNNDGGYLVGINSIKEAEVLVSLGINDDWSFEKSFKKLNSDLVIECYDSIPIQKNLIKLIILEFIFLPYRGKIKNLWATIKNLYDFMIFKKKAKFIKKNIFYGDLEKILKSFSKKNIFLKVDIEGTEYRILEEILNFDNNLTGLVCEFHDVDLNINQIYKFAEKINLELVHIHPNNCSPVDKEGNPIVIELTFEKKPLIVSETNNLPNKLDMKNDENLTDIKINFDE